MHEAGSGGDAGRQMARLPSAFHAARVPLADGFLRVCDAVHEHGRHRAARNQRLAMAALPNRLHDWHRVDIQLTCVSNRARARLLIAMSSAFQTIAALVIVAVATAWLIAPDRKSTRLNSSHT